MLTGPAAAPEDFLTLGTKLHRPLRAPDLSLQSKAFAELSALVAADPAEAIRRCGDIARRLCRGGSAGLTLVRPSAIGAATLHWSAISGALSPYEGAETPASSSPCGTCLDTKMTVVLSRPERMFPYLRRTRPLIVEDLIVPLYDVARNPVGTFWIVHHDVTSHFTAEDAQVMERIATQVTLSLRLLQLTRERRSVRKSHEAARRAANRELIAERSLRKAAEAAQATLQTTLADRETSIGEAHHRVKNTIQIVSSLLALQARTSPSEEVRHALRQSQARLQILAKVHELLYRDADDVREISMQTLLREVGEALRQSFPVTNVSLRVTSDAISLAPMYGIPMALLVNEIVTNAYKHAFPDGQVGAIAVTLSNTTDGVLLLQVVDDGIGMSASDETHGLGLKLIRSFAARLHGDLAFGRPTSGTGTVVTMLMCEASPLAGEDPH